MIPRQLHVIGNFLPLLTGFISAPLTARALGTDGRGQFSLVLSVSGVLMTIAAFGLPWLARADLQKSPAALNQWQRRTLVVGVLAVPIAVVAAVGVAPLGDLRLEDAIPAGTLFVLSAFAATRGVEANALIALNRLDLFGVANISGTLLNLAALVILFLSGHLTVSAALWASCAAVVVQFGLMAVFLKRVTPPPAVGMPTEFGSRMIIRAIRAWGAQIFESVATRADILVVSLVASTSVLGLYSVVALLPQASYTLMATIVQQSYARKRAGSSEEHFVRVMQTCVVVGVTFVVLVAPIFWELVPVVFGEAFVDARDYLLPAAFIAVGLSTAAPVAQRISGGEAAGFPFALIVLASAAVGFGTSAATTTGIGLLAYGLAMTIGCVVYAIAVTKWRVVRFSAKDVVAWWRDA